MIEQFWGAVFLLAFGFITGLRHGIDIDHIAAITDIIGSQRHRRRGMVYSSFYAFGHGVMVVILGILLIFIGQRLPPSIDFVFGKIVGATLIILGVYVFFSIVRYGSHFQMRSRWMLVFSAIRFGYHKLLHNFDFSHKHPKLKEEKYGSKSAFGIGLIHGVGAETPTQVAALAALVGIGGGIKAVLFLLFFVLGIFCSNLTVAIFSSYGYLRARQRNKIYLVIGLLTGIFSLSVGILFLIS